MANGTIESTVGPIRRTTPPAGGAGVAAPRVVFASASGRARPDLVDRIGELGASVTEVPSLAALVAHLEARPVDLCFLDLTGERAPGTPVRMIRARHPRLRLVGIVDPHEPLAAGDAVQHGLSDVLPWPVAERDLQLVMANAADRAAWVADAAVTGGTTGEPVFAQSVAMQELLDRIGRLADGRGGALIVGQPGTGRSLLARTLHRLSAGGTDRPFVRLDGIAMPPGELERALFGVPLDRRADRLTPIQVGADSAVMRARGGTLYLTQVPELPARVQSALARLVRDREALAAGRRDVLDIDIRLAVAFDADDVEPALADGRLQAELHDRVSAGRVEVPPLRRRREDLPALAAWLLGRACRRAGVGPKAFSRSALSLVAALPWPGNAGELNGLIEALVRHVSRPVLHLDDVLDHASLDGLATRIDAGMTLRDAKARFERECIAAVLRRHHGRVGEAAKALGIQRTNLYRKVRQLNVSRSLLSPRR